MRNDSRLKAPREFCITIVGKTREVNSRRDLEPSALPYLMDRLLSGEEVLEYSLTLFGLRLWVEWDTDGGSEEQIHVSHFERMMEEDDKKRAAEAGSAGTER